MYTAGGILPNFSLRRDNAIISSCSVKAPVFRQASGKMGAVGKEGNARLFQTFFSRCVARTSGLLALVDI